MAKLLSMEDTPVIFVNEKVIIHLHHLNIEKNKERCLGWVI